MAGASESNDIDVSGNHGANDIWVLKTDSIGSILWQKCIGGSFDDIGWSVQATRDSGLIVACRSNSHDGDVIGNHGSGDYFIFKMDSIGNIEWTKCLGGTDDEQANCIRQTRDGGYIVAGGANSNDGDVIGNHANHSVFPDNDFWVVKLSPSGTGMQDDDHLHSFDSYYNEEVGTICIRVGVESEQEFIVQITDISGRTIYNKTINAVTGLDKYNFQIDDFSRGMYFISLTNGLWAATNKLIF